jgi:hypothetical protein
MGEQERTEIWARALRIGPADHDKLLAVQALDLEPQAAVAGRVRRIGPF